MRPRPYGKRPLLATPASRSCDAGVAVRVAALEMPGGAALQLERLATILPANCSLHGRWPCANMSTQNHWKLVLVVLVAFETASLWQRGCPPARSKPQATSRSLTSTLPAPSPYSRGQAPGCQGQAGQKGRPEGHARHLAAQGPHERLVPPADDSQARACAQVPAQVDPPPPAHGRVPGHQEPAQHRDRHEED